MKGIFKRGSQEAKIRVLAVLICIAANVGPAFAAYKTGLPMFLDTAGTIAISMLGGLFPGLITAVATNLLCGFFNTNSLFYTFIGVAIAVCTVMISNRNRGRRKRDIISLIIILSLEHQLHFKQ